MKYNKKVILTDADGVLLNWEYAFTCWMEQHGHTQVENANFLYNIGERFGITAETGKLLVKQFNESAAIGFLPALRDAMYYVKRLHEEHGYVFRCITSLSLDKNAYKLRKMNLEKLFGETAFEELVCLVFQMFHNIYLQSYIIFHQLESSLQIIFYLNLLKKDLFLM